MINIYKSKLFFIIFFLFCMFPWVQVIPNSFGIQPNAALFGSLVITFSFFFTKHTKALLFFISFPIIYFLLDTPNLNAFRGLFNYLSFCIVYIAAFNFFRYQSVNPLLFLVTSFVYLIVGAIQKYVDPVFATGLVYQFFGNVNSYMGRGVVSLAAEATFFGFHMLFMAFLLSLIIIVRRKVSDLSPLEKKIIFFSFLFIFFNIFILSMSSSAILTLILFFIFLIFSKSRLKVKLFFIIILPMVTFSYLILNPTSRISSIVHMFLFNNYSDLLIDRSIYDRINQIVVSLYSPFTNYGFGFGYNQWTIVLNEYSQYFRIDTRVTSGLGSISFELGFIPLIIFIYLLIYRPLRRFFNEYLIGFFLLFFVILLILLIQGIPISYPLIALILAFVGVKTSFIKK